MDAAVVVVRRVRVIEELRLVGVNEGLLATTGTRGIEILTIVFSGAIDLIGAHFDDSSAGTCTIETPSTSSPRVFEVSSLNSLSDTVGVCQLRVGVTHESGGSEVNTGVDNGGLLAVKNIVIFEHRNERVVPVTSDGDQEHDCMR